MQHRFGLTFLLVCPGFVIRRHNPSQMFGGDLSGQCCHFRNFPQPSSLKGLETFNSADLHLIPKISQLPLMILVNQFQPLILLLQNLNVLMMLVLMSLDMLANPFNQNLLGRLVDPHPLVFLLALRTRTGSVTVSAHLVYHLNNIKSQPMIVNLPTLIPLKT